MGEKTNKKELILAAAQEIFLEKGYYNSTSEEIAKRAGVGKGTLYEYFSSKQDIFLEVQCRSIEQYGDSIGDCIDLNASFEENLRCMIHFHVENMNDMVRDSVQIMMELLSMRKAEFPGTKVMQETKQKIVYVLEQMVIAGQKRGDLKQIDSRLLIYSITGIFISVIHMLGRYTYTEEEKKELEETLAQCILHGVASVAEA